MFLAVQHQHSDMQHLQGDIQLHVHVHVVKEWLPWLPPLLVVVEHLHTCTCTCRHSLVL